MEQGSVADVTAAAAGEGLRVRIRHGDSEIPPELWSRFESEYEASTEPDGHFVLVLNDEDEIPGIIDELRAASVPIYGVVPTRLRLEQAFIELVRAKGGSEQVARRDA